MHLESHAVPRAQRRMTLFRQRKEAIFDPEHVHVESALRGKTARKVRNQLRRMDPVALLTPRWTAPQAFLEDIALDLAVGEGMIASRTVNLRPLMGRTEAEAWNFLLRVLAELGGPGLTAIPMVLNRRGFHVAAADLLDRAHDSAPNRVALLAHGAQHLPVEVLCDLTEAWASYALRARTWRRCTVLLAGAVATPALDVGNAARIDLADFGEAEAAATFLRTMGGVSFPVLQRVSTFSGGVPALVDALATGVATLGRVPMQSGELFRLMGAVADDVQGAVSMAMTQPDLAERLLQLADGEPRIRVPETDEALFMAGLVRRSRSAKQVQLRAPALATVF